MKVFMLMRFLDFSGAPKMFLWVANALAESGHDVTVYVFSNNIACKPNVKIKFIHEELTRKNLISRIFSIRKAIKNSNADISISFLLDANVYNTLACVGLRTKSVICERSDPFKPGYYKLKILKPIFHFADGAVFQLNRVAKYYSNIKKHTIVIPNPVTNRSKVILKPFRQRGKFIVSAGRIDIKQKRNDIQIKAFALFHKNHPDYKMIIYGTALNDDEKRLKKLISDLGLRDNVIMAGVVDDVQQAMKNCQIFILSSDFEGIPNSLIEAMVIGMPCISTDCSPGGASLLIKDNLNGLLVPCEDYYILAQKMCWLVEHPDEADILGENAKQILNQFSEKKIAKMWNEYVISFS